jgi:hypothetical protein
LQAPQQPKLETKELPVHEDEADKKARETTKKMWSWIKAKAQHAGLHDWLMVVFTGVLTLVAIGQGLLAWQNSKVSTAQIRPWLAIQPPPAADFLPHAGAILKIMFEITNTGVTPAKDLQIFFNAGFFPGGIEPPYKFVGQPMPLGNLSGQSKTFFHFNGESCGPLKIPENQMFIIYGATTYEDVFRQKHWTTYCFISRKDSYDYCPKHNDIGDGDLPKGALEQSNIVPTSPCGT